jgi:hypothetical protein
MNTVKITTRQAPTRRLGIRLAVLAGATVLAVTASAAVTEQPAAAHHGGGHRAYGCRTVALQSAANHLFVSAEAGDAYGGDWAGMLRARNTYIGPWEKFQLCSVDDSAWPDGVALWAESVHGWVSAEIGYGGAGMSGLLRGRPYSDTIETWEEFRIINLGGTNHIALFSAANYDVVTAELDYPTNDTLYGRLRARTNVLGPWEQFYISYL